MTAQPSARATVDEAMTEKEWQTLVVELAKANGWLIYHTLDSRRSPAGFPDLVMIRGVVMIALELKSEKGKVSPDQQTWVNAFKKVRIVRADIARPGDWDEVRQTLSARAR